MAEAGDSYSNPHNEIETAMHATSMGNDADPVTLLLRTLKIGLVDGWTGLALCTDMQDILFGTPQVRVTQSSAGVLSKAASTSPCTATTRCCPKRYSNGR